jgi:hypothetical protein
MVVVGLVIDRKKGFVNREAFKFGGNENEGKQGEHENPFHLGIPFSQCYD